jgi:hypothetical protein
VRLIRARRGVLTAAELVQHTGLPLAEAEEEMARLMATYDGDVRVSDAGVLTYVFPELMLSAQGPVAEAEPDPAWRRLEARESLTGNRLPSDLLIGGINAFNLVAAATAPLFIFPRLGLGGGAAWVGLVWVPLAFSTLFFAIPALRALAVGRWNRARAARNLRRVLLGQVMEASLARDRGLPLSLAGALERVRGAVSGRRAGPAQRAARGIGEPAREWEGRGAGEGEATPAFPPQAALDAAVVEARLQELLAEFDGDVTEAADGTVHYAFPGIRRQFEESERMRRALALERQRVGAIVYASDETEEEARQREAEAFDRELERGRALERYLQAPDRVAVLDDFELVAFEEEMAVREPEAAPRRPAPPWR